MSETLYQKLVWAESLNVDLEEHVQDFNIALSKFEGLPGFSGISIGDIPEIDISEVERKLIREYEGNPVLDDAIHGRQSIRESLDELAQVNTGIRKFLPRRKNKAHNERLEQLGQLVTKPDHLSAVGVWYTDNVVTGAVGVSALTFATCYAVAKFLIPDMDINPDPDYIAKMTSIYQTVMPAFASALLAPLIGFAMNLNRLACFGAKLPTQEAGYLDLKVKEFYK